MALILSGPFYRHVCADTCIIGPALFGFILIPSLVLQSPVGNARAYRNDKITHQQI